MRASPEAIEKLKHLWNVWNLRGFILFSFSLQCILIFGSSLRIQTSKSWVHRVIWFVYLLADWAAYYAIGLVVPVDRLQSKNEYTSDIHAFWAPFLLLHIGGPNTIAGFSLEDNELWDRSVLHIIVQAGATGIAIYRALSKQQLLAPTILVFIAALSRYAGRILALSKGSLDDLRDSISDATATSEGDEDSTTMPSAGTNERAEGDASTTIPIEVEDSTTMPSAGTNERAEGEDSTTMPSAGRQVGPVAPSYKSFQKYKGLFCGLSTRTRERAEHTCSMAIPSEGTDLRAEDAYNSFQMVDDAYKSFQMYKGIFCGLSIRADKVVMANRERLYKLVPDEAFTEMEIQLSLAYDLFYTKIWTIIENKAGMILHIISLSSEVGALVLWAFAKKHGYEKVDIQLTNTLLIGGIAIDVASTLKLTFTDLVIYHLSKCCPKSPILACVLSAKKSIQGKFFVVFRRWSGSIKQFNLILYEDHCRPCVVKLLRLIFGYTRGISRVKLTEDMKNHISMSIKNRASKNGILDTKLPRLLGSYILEMYDEQVLLANALKQICECVGVVDALLVYHIATHYFYPKGKVGNEEDIFRDVNIHISEYLMYLLFYHPSMILEGAELDMTPEDMTKHLDKIKKMIANDESMKDVPIARDELDFVEELEEQKTILGDILKQVGGGGMEIKVGLISELAKYILGILRGGTMSEELLSDIWIDFLLYAAIHCRARIHVQQLGNGGQLITIVWLMMTHLGLKMKSRN